MQISKEAIGEIINFAPKNHKGEPRVDLGEIARDTNLVYGVYAYRRRIAGVPGEPFTEDWTRQPVLALESKDKDGRVTARPLAYAADVRALEEDQAVKILDRLAIQGRRQVPV